MERSDQCLAHIRMCTGGNQGRGLASRHFLRKTGAAEYASLQLRGHLGLYLMAQQAVGALHRGLKTLAQPSHGRRHPLQLGQHAAQGGHGGGHNDQVTGVYRSHQTIQRLGTELQCGRQCLCWEVVCVFTLGRHVCHQRSVTRPKRNGTACQWHPCRTDGQRSTPSTGTQHYDIHSCLRNIHAA